jgi:hypothetical protein
VYSVIIRANDGTTFVKLPNEGGADEVWFDNPTTTSNSSSSFHYFLAEGGCTSNCGRNSHQGINRLGIIDLISVLGTETSDTFPGGQDVFIGFSGSTTRRAHSVAAWSGELANSSVDLPAVGGTPGPFSSTLCGNFAAQGCIGMLAVTPIPNGNVELGE